MFFWRRQIGQYIDILLLRITLLVIINKGIYNYTIIHTIRRRLVQVMAYYCQCRTEREHTHVTICRGKILQFMQISEWTLYQYVTHTKIFFKESTLLLQYLVY